MKEKALQVWIFLRKTFDRYPVIVAALVIYLYYLLTSFNLFQHKGEKDSFLDYIIQFDSLFFLWIAAAALLQVQKLRRSYKKEEEHRHNIERILDRQQIYSQLVNEITALLQDNVNNPLAVISVTTQEMRKKFEHDDEIVRWLDRIDGAMQRIHHTIGGIHAYETQKMIDSSKEVLKTQQSTPS